MQPFRLDRLVRRSDQPIPCNSPSVCDTAVMTEHKRLVRTAEAARALAVAPSTLWRWEKAGLVKPALRTAGGQARWDLDRLKAEVQAISEGQDQN